MAAPSRIVFAPDAEMRAELERYRVELGLRSANAAARALVATALRSLANVSIDTALMQSVTNEAKAELRAAFLEAVTRALTEREA